MHSLYKEKNKELMKIKLVFLFKKSTFSLITRLVFLRGKKGVEKISRLLLLLPFWLLLLKHIFSP